VDLGTPTPNAANDTKVAAPEIEKVNIVINEIFPEPEENLIRRNLSSCSIPQIRMWTSQGTK